MGVLARERDLDNTTLAASPDIALHLTGVPVLGHVALKAVHVEAQFPGIRGQVPVIEPVLVLIQELVHLPKASPRARGLRRLGGVLRERVDGRERELAEHEPQPIAESFLDFPAGLLRLAAVETLLIPILDHG
jgi:hypothetical protein